MISDILEVDGGHGMLEPLLHHVARQAPLLGVSVVPEDLVMPDTSIVDTLVTSVHAVYRTVLTLTEGEDLVVQGGDLHVNDGPGQGPGQAPGAGPWGQHLSGGQS